MNVRKAVILAAGYGTRFLPATKAIPKEMLPILDRPAIQYIVDEAVASGIDHIVIVTSAHKAAIEAHFTPDRALEQFLEEKHAESALADVRRIASRALFSFVLQERALGTANALLQARHVIGDEPFAVFYPDDIIASKVPALRQLMDVHNERAGSVLALHRLPREEVVHYGVIDPETLAERIHRVKAVIEKPSVASAPSNLTIVGRFILTPDVWSVIERTPAGVGGELFLTDTFGLLAAGGYPILGYEYEGDWLDIGRPVGLLKASIHIALARNGLRDELRSYLRSLRIN